MDNSFARKYKLTLVNTLLLIILSTIQTTYAADKYGQFGVRGAGLISCAVYVNERKAQADVYLMTAAWIDGYITATNENRVNTYDILSFETTELLTEVINKHCQNNPNDVIFTVIKSLFIKLQKDRLQLNSKKIGVSIGHREVFLYESTIKKIQQRLHSLGFYKGKIDSSFGKLMIESLKQYQLSIRFHPTGFPDQATLWHLLRSAN